MTDNRPAALWRAAPALVLLLLAPVSAEYLYGFDDSTGNPEELVGGLIVFGPLYGGAALIIREVARRMGRGRSTMLILAFAFGDRTARRRGNGSHRPSASSRSPSELARTANIRLPARG